MHESKLRLVVLISGGGTNLQSILDAIDRETLNAEVVAVISNRAEAGGLERARRHGVPAIHIERTGFSSRELFDSAVADEIVRYQPDIIALAGFMHVLGENFVNAFSEKIVNIHPSLLPKFRGLDTHERALEAGETIHGATVHYVTAELDDGPIIVQAEVSVFEDDTPETLQQRVLEREHVIYPAALQWIAEGRIDFHNPQPER